MRYIVLLLLLIFFYGCSDKDPIANKPAIYWYQELIKQASWGNMDGAEENYDSLLGEHAGSPLLKPAMLIMANAHMKNEEYILANYYLDEYAKRYGSKNNLAYIKFLKLKANYYGLQFPKRDQKLLIDTKRKSKKFIEKFSNSNYAPLANTIITNITLSEDVLNENIAKLYKKLDKPKASKFYKEKESLLFKNYIFVEYPKTGWFRSIFE